MDRSHLLVGVRPVNYTAAGGCEAMDRQLGALSQALEQWEGAALRARDGLEGALGVATTSEEDYERRTTRLEDDSKELDARLRGWSQELVRAEGLCNGEEAVMGWQLAKDIYWLYLNAELGT